MQTQPVCYYFFSTFSFLIQRGTGGHYGADLSVKIDLETADKQRTAIPSNNCATKIIFSPITA